jgi:hypothetical protein
MLNLPIDLGKSENTLFLGIGGGFDIYGAIPLFAQYRDTKTDFFFANINASVKDRLSYPPHEYPCPEGWLSAWLHRSGYDTSVYALPRLGVRVLRQHLSAIVKDHNIDTIVCVDGGVDSLMTGDEEGAGTILEDFVTMQAVSTLRVAKVLVCVGFGTETDEEVCHHAALENMAALAASGAFWGCASLTKDDQEYQTYKEVCDESFKVQGRRKSHVHTKIISAVEGRFGNNSLYEDVDPQLGGKTTAVNYINPLMPIMWFYDLDKVLALNKLAKHFEDTNLSTDVLLKYRQVKPELRKRQAIPL